MDVPDRSIYEAAGFSSKFELYDYIQGHELSYTYGKLTYDSYTDIYQSQDYCSRKIIAIPHALFSGLILSVYHLACAILTGMTSLCSGKGETAKIYLYRCARDMHESLGWIVTLFNDKLGSYLISDSLFHQECYDQFECPATSSSRAYIEGVEIPNIDQAEKISLRAFYEMTPEKRQAAIQKFDLGEFDNCGGKDYFYKQLENANKSALELASIKDLKLHSKTNLRLSYLLLSDHTFKQMDVSLVSTCSDESIKFLVRRLKQFDLPAGFENIEGEILDFYIIQFCRLPGHRIVADIAKIPNQLLALVTDDQLKDMDLSQFSKEQIGKLFLDRDNIDEVAKRFALLSVPQVQSILNILDAYDFQLLSEDHLKGVDITGLTSWAINRYFDLIPLNFDVPKRISCIPITQIRIVLDELMLSALELVLFHPQFHTLDLSYLSQDQVDKLFPQWSVDNIRVYHQKNSSYHLKSNIGGTRIETNVYPEEIIIKESLAKKEGNQKRLALLSTVQKGQIRDKLSPDNLELLPQR